MENQTSLGQPIPMGVITPTEILAPADGSASSEFHDNNMFPMREFAPSTLPPAQILTGMMFAPFIAWTVITASYLRFFELPGRELGEA